MSSSAGRVLMIPKGEYNSSTQYYQLDVVLYNGDSYVAKQNTIGNAPTNTTYWQPMTTAAEDVNSLKETFTKNGAHNLLPLTLSKIKSLNTHGTWSGNTCVIDDVSFRCDTDGNDIITQIYTSGTNTEGDSNLYIFDDDISGSYKLSGCPSGGSSSSYNISTSIDGTWVVNSYDIGNGSDIIASSHLKLVIHVSRNISAPSTLWKPMLRLASDPDSTFAPYAMTNRELTNALNSFGFEVLNLSGKSIASMLADANINTLKFVAFYNAPSDAPTGTGNGFGMAIIIKAAEDVGYSRVIYMINSNYYMGQYDKTNNVITWSKLTTT